MLWIIDLFSSVVVLRISTREELTIVIDQVIHTLIYRSGKTFNIVHLTYGDNLPYRSHLIYSYPLFVGVEVLVMSWWRSLHRRWAHDWWNTYNFILWKFLYLSFGNISQHMGRRPQVIREYFSRIDRFYLYRKSNYIVAFEWVLSLIRIPLNLSIHVSYILLSLCWVPCNSHQGMVSIFREVLHYLWITLVLLKQI